MPVAIMVAPAVGAMERVGGRHIMPVEVMVAPAVCRTGGCKLGMGRVGSAPQPHRTLQKSRLYLVIVAVTIRRKHRGGHCRDGYWW